MSLKKQKKTKTKTKTKKGRKKTYLSFDFSNFDIRVVKGYYYNSNLVVQKAFVIKFDEEIYNDGKILEYDVIVEGVQEAMKEHGIKEKEAIFTISTTEAISKTFEVPKLDKDEDQVNAIEFALDENFSFDITDYVVDYRIIGDSKTTCDVYACMVKKLLVEEKVRLFKDLGLKLKYVDINTNSISKLLRYTIENSSNIPGYNIKDKEQPTVAFIDLGSTVLSMNVYRLGYTEFQRSTTNDFIARFKNLTYVPGSAEDVTYRDYNTDEELEYSVGALIDEVERGFKYFTSKNLGNSIDDIFVYGYEYAVKGLNEVVEDRFNGKVHRFSKMNEIIDVPDDVDLSMYVNCLGSLIRVA
ncbi:MAG: pilus assembly protein PilM [Lachnospirales bacterium]